MLHREASMFHIAGDDEAIREEESSNSIADMVKKSAGLQLLIQIPSRIYSMLTKSTSSPSYSKDKSNCETSGFLKFCFLCHKELTIKMDIFMYREQAFCSVECRDQKMIMDKRNELEISHLDHLHYRRKKDSNVRGLSRRKGRLLVINMKG